MKYKTFFSIILILVITSTESFGLEKFTYGIKGGVGLWKASFEKGYYYSYPLGFTVGIFFENKISNNLFLVNELYFQNSITSLIKNPALSDALLQKLTTRYLNFPILLKYQTKWLSDTYFYLGPSLAFLLDAEYYNKIQFGETRNVTNEVPRFNAAVEAGFGEEIKLYNTSLNLELRAQLSLTNIHPHDFDSWSVGDWRNLGLIFLVGFNL